MEDAESMELNIIEDKKNRLVFELKGEGHSLCNALRKELWNDSHVKAAAYTIEHPLVGVPRFILDTDGADTYKTITGAIKRLQKQTAKIRAEAKALK